MRHPKRFWITQAIFAAPVSIVLATRSWSQATQAGCTAGHDGLLTTLIEAAPCVEGRTWGIWAAALVLSGFYGLFIADWDNGPAEWAKDQTAFAAGAGAFIATAAGWAFLFGYLGIPTLFGSNAFDSNFEFQSGAHELVFVIYLFVWIGLGALWVGVLAASKAHKSTLSALNSNPQGGGAITAVGSGLGTGVAAIVGASVFAMIAMVALFVFVMYVMLWTFAGVALLGLASAAKK